MCPHKLGRPAIIFHQKRLVWVRVVPNYSGFSLKIYFSYKPIYCTVFKFKPALYSMFFLYCTRSLDLLLRPAQGHVGRVEFRVLTTPSYKLKSRSIFQHFK